MLRGLHSCACIALAAALLVPGLARAEGKTPPPARPAASAAATTPYRSALQQGHTFTMDARRQARSGDPMRAGAQHVYASYAFEKAAAHAPNPQAAQKAQRLAGNAQTHAAHAYLRAGDRWAAATSFQSAEKHYSAAGMSRAAGSSRGAATLTLIRAQASGQSAYPRLGH